MRAATVHLRRNHPRAFTLLEALVVCIIVGILGVTAIPALQSTIGARQAAAANEVERVLVSARARAMATGRPWGVEVDRTNNRVRVLTIETTNAAPTAPTALGAGTSGWVTLSELFPDASLSSVTDLSGSSVTTCVIWFASDGQPQTRNSSGLSPASATSNALLTFAGGRQVLVRQYAGVVEVQ